MLPEKIAIENWICQPVIERLMSDYKWNYKTSKLWFHDFMRWTYSSIKWKQEKNTIFIMDGMHYLDEVWHAYIIHTKEYFKMSKELFNIEYIHHSPAPAFKKELIDKQVYQEQLVFLLNEWGEDYINRVWSLGADIFDITNGSYEIAIT